MANWFKSGLAITGAMATDPVGTIKKITGIGKDNTTQELSNKIQNTPSPIDDSESIKTNIIEPSKEIMQDQWQREDTIRKETQEREDTAYQRAVEDMRKAGINPNLIGINPASSGGGITQTSGETNKNTLITQKFNEQLTKLTEELNLKDNEKERFQSSFDNLLRSVLGIIDIG